MKRYFDTDIMLEYLTAKEILEKYPRSMIHPKTYKKLVKLSIKKEMDKNKYSIMRKVQPALKEFFEGKEKKMNKNKLDPPHLVHNFDDSRADYIGIGMVFPYKGKMAKVAVRFENDVTSEELKRGIKRLIESESNPEESGSGVVFEGRLTGREIMIRGAK